MSYPFKQAKHYHKGDNLAVNRIVIHRMQSDEKGTSAEACAQYFATTDRVASAHLCIDNNSVVQCVKFEDVAYHAPPNYHSIGVEHAGRGEDWADDVYDDDMLKLSAMAVADLCRQFNIPAKWLGVNDLRANKTGITSHYNVSMAFGKTTHTDGKLFPYERYLNMVNFFPSPQPVYIQKDAEMIIDVVDALPAPNGGVWILAKDGGVFTYKGANFYGSYPGLNIDAGNKRTFGNILSRDDGGYDLLATSSERYEFPAV